MGKRFRRFSLALAGFAMALAAGVAIGTSAGRTPKETLATGAGTDVLFAKGFAGYTTSSYSDAGTDRTGVANSTNVSGVTYALQVFNGSSGQVKGSGSGAANFSARNITTQQNYYISQITLTVSGGTLDGNTSSRSVVYFGSSSFANPNVSAPTGASTASTQGKSGQATLTWVNNDTDVNYFILYNLKTSGTALSSDASTALTVTWAAKPTPTSISVSTAPTKTNYDAGETFRPSGLVITRTYSDESTKTLAYKDHESDFTFSPSLSTPLATSDVSITIGNLGVTTSQAITVTEPKVLGSIAIKTAPENTDVIAGEYFDPTGLVITATYTDTTSSDISYADYPERFSFSPSLDTPLTFQDTSVTVTYTYNEVAKTASQDISVINPDILTRSYTGVAATSTYNTWDSKNGTSGTGAVYAGNSAGANDTIQLRKTDSSGIVTTASGGLVKKIRVTWYSGTTDARRIDIFGKNLAYSSSADLSSDDTKGELLGSITKGSTTELTVSGNYKYFGILANNALYIEKIEVFWEPVLTLSPASIDVTKSTSDSSVAVAASNFGGTPTITASTASDKFTVSYNSGTGHIDITAGSTTCSDQVVTVTASYTDAKGTISKNATLLVSVVEPRSFDSLEITTDTSDVSFIDGGAFSVTGLVVTASFSNSTTLVFSSANSNLGSLVYTVSGNPYEIGDRLNEGTGDKTVVVSYTDPTTSTTRSASSYTINIVAATVTEGSWSNTKQTQFKCFAGVSVLTEAIVNSWNVSATWDNGRTDSGLQYGDFTLALGGEPIDSLPYVWQEEDDGKALTLEYYGYSITSGYAIAHVISALNPIDEDGDVGDVQLDNLISVATITSAGTYGNPGGSASANNGIFTATSDGAYFAPSTWTIYPSQAVLTITSTKTISSIEFTFVSGYEGFEQSKYTSINNTTFSVGALTQARITGIKIVYSDIVVTHYANVNYDAQKAVIQFAQTVNTQMNAEGVCSTDSVYGVHDIDKLKEAWNAIATEYNDLFGDGEGHLTGDTLTAAQNMLRVATAKWNDDPDCLQRALKTYEFVVANYSAELTAAGVATVAFMSAIRGVSPAARVNPLSFNADTTNPAMIAIVLLGLSVAVVGVYFFLKRRQERE